MQIGPYALLHRNICRPARYTPAGVLYMAGLFFGRSAGLAYQSTPKHRRYGPKLARTDARTNAPAFRAPRAPHTPTQRRLAGRRTLWR